MLKTHVPLCFLPRGFEVHSERLPTVKDQEPGIDSTLLIDDCPHSSLIQEILLAYILDAQLQLTLGMGSTPPCSCECVERGF